ncbi:hypothetical protein P171DRAFT_491031 [Karstenula rhodostoma CBS 690.94]|uniref:Uncharacterized protein n=1 Tax=Karstenula rhodostoma CBS 690.94 TaxID=1392251 RepID=A0A9P4P6R3_9PLEO|nr:hypothetical protein P171DRAFT_491031 [Karstenula rhodostoma CBS 690.94]
MITDAELAEIEETLKKLPVSGVQKVSQTDFSNAESLLTPFTTAIDGVTITNFQPGESAPIPRDVEPQKLLQFRSFEIGSSVGASIIDSIKKAEYPAISRFLLVDLAGFEDNHSVASYSLDSIIGAGLRTCISKEYSYDMSIQQLLAPYLTIPALAETNCGVHDIGGGTQAAAALWVALLET